MNQEELARYNRIKQNLQHYIQAWDKALSDTLNKDGAKSIRAFKKLKKDIESTAIDDLAFLICHIEGISVVDFKLETWMSKQSEDGE